MKHCLAIAIAAIATLLGGAVAVATARTAAGQVRHERISRPAKQKCARHRARKHGKRGKRGCSPKRANKGRHDKHARKHGHAGKGRHKGLHALRQRPATASRDCPGANLTPDAEDIAEVRAATLCLINEERARFGEQALIEDARLQSAATGHSRDMDAHDYFEHTSPGGQTLLDRIQASGFIPDGNVGYTLGENIAWGSLWLGSPRAIVKAWMGSPGHRANILDDAYRYSGIGVDPNLPSSMSGGQAGGMYTQDFGAILG